MKTSEIRQKFLSFFQERGHRIVPSSPLIPANDPSLLFTNAGMVQFKDVFTGKETRPYDKAVTSQRCVRAGGKHNDLENVGYTARHHTFFEMLGNFSFGDYFKSDAITYAWELLTQVYKLPTDKLWVTVYHEDDEAYNIWANEIGVPHERIIRIGDDEGGRYSSDNFWQMADTGPCGPCSEIFYDHGPEIWGGPPGSPEEDGDRYIEIWNLVFMQFDKDADGNLNPLPKPCVDTGMGLERISAVLQHVHSNYEIDLFQSLINAAARVTNALDLNSNSLKVIADHIRACSFLIIDGIIPGNEGRGYVLRRIIRRALRHGYKLGQNNLFFYKLVADLAKVMGDAYPELISQQDRIAQVIRQEEERFSDTLDNGMKILDAALAEVKEGGTLDGKTLFNLYDTYGFPVDLTADICRERNVAVDYDGFDMAMEQQRQQARAAGKFTSAENIKYEGVSTNFLGYEDLESQATITALYIDGTSVDSLSEGDEGIVVLDNTPFYAESGGQVGDQGVLGNNAANFRVQDTKKIQNTVFGHYGVLQSGSLKVGDKLKASVNADLRAHTIRNHSATHLMHKALRQVLGNHVQQRGSLVDAHKTRFDFSHDAPLTSIQIAQIERIVNQEILNNQPVGVQMMSYEEAVSNGAVALFGEKYDDTVRVLDIGFSRELCGGTHVKNTGDIGFFKIVTQTSVAAGVRRIEAVTGFNALMWVQSNSNLLEDIASILKTSPSTIGPRITALQDQVRDLERERDQLKQKLTSAAGNSLLEQATILPNQSKLLLAALDGIEQKNLRSMVDQAKESLGSAIILLASVSDGRIALVAGVTPDLIKQINAGDLVAMVATLVGGKGGGRPDMAMGGGTMPESLPGAMQAAQSWIMDIFND